jgi:hypothetical protein
MPLKTLHLLERYHPDFTDSKLSKEKLFKKLFPQQNFSDNKLNKLFSEIIRLYEDFVVLQLHAPCEAKRGLQLSEYYLQRSMYKYFVSNQKSLLQLISAYPEGTQKNLLMYEYEVLQLHYNSKNDERRLSFQTAYDALNEFTLTEKLRWQNLSSISLPQPLNEHEVTNLFYLAHQQLSKLLESGAEEDFEQMFAWAKQHLAGFEKEQSREILGVLKDFCIRKVGKAEKRYYQELIDIYDCYIQLGIIAESDGYIKTASYKNYITCCLKIDKIEQAESFLEGFKSQVDPEFIDDVYLFNKANILFEKGMMDAVQSLLHTASFKDLFYKISAKRLLIKTYFEWSLKDSSYTDITEHAISAFKKFIYTNSDLPGTYSLANKNFIKLILPLERGRLVSERAGQLKAEIAAETQVAERDWLLKHADLLITQSSSLAS